MKHDPDNVLNHPLVTRERIKRKRYINRLEAWLIVTAGIAILALSLLSIS